MQYKEVSPTVLIIADGVDVNIKELVEWLQFYEVEVFRICASEDLVTLLDYDMQQQQLRLQIEHPDGNYILNLDRLKTTYLRPAAINFKVNYGPSEFASQIGVRNYYLTYVEAMNDFLEYYLRNHTEVIGLWGNGLINKLIVLEEAKKAGLAIPDSYLSTHLNSIRPNAGFVTKSFGSAFTCRFEGHNCGGYTARLKDLDTDHTFMPTFFQKEVKKQFEVRVYIFQGEVIYSMAIFSQMNEQSAVDYRKYDKENPYLDEPFSLPQELETKLLHLMTNLQLNKGSIDLIYADDGEYYFLEINPNGQFGYVGKVNGINPYQLMAKKMRIA